MILVVTVSLLVISCSAEIFGNTGGGTLSVETDPAVQTLDRVPCNQDEGLDAYIDNGLYTTFDLDIDMDGVQDKVVSSAQNAGNELIFFRNTEKGCRKALVSTNLTEDGGRTLGKIKQESTNGGRDEVLSMETYFPRGMDVATHYVSYSGNEWGLSRTVYEISDWRDRRNVVYRCEVEQSISMHELVSEEAVSRVRQIPDQSDRDHMCTLQSPSGT
ncbi:hypothetical protein [Luteimonas suaedae]|uniref:hypothetical protein n=1 Tax=Luteimonas suaedae TaxID=2605430 RepID=UPI0011ED7F82|nr:hypothetical protein [Luteimonas suaedae]